MVIRLARWVAQHLIVRLAQVLGALQWRLRCWQPPAVVVQAGNSRRRTKMNKGAVQYQGSRKGPETIGVLV